MVTLARDQLPEENRLKFLQPWIKVWMREYGVSLRKRNKQFTILKNEAFGTNEDDTDIIVEQVCDEGIVKEVTQNLFERVVQTEEKIFC